MSNQKISAIDKNNLYRVSETRNEKVATKIQFDDNLRDLVLDFVLNEFVKSKEKPLNPVKAKQKLIRKPIFSSSNKTLKKMLIQFSILLSTKQKIRIEYDVLSLIQKYMQQEGKSQYEQTNIKSLVDEIILFIEQIQSVVEKIEFNFSSNQQRLHDKVIRYILHNHFKQKQRLRRTKDLDILKSKTINNHPNPQNKSQTHKQSSMNNLLVQDQFKNNPGSSRRISRDNISSTNLLMQNLNPVSKQNKTTKSQLKDIVDNYKVFLYPEKISQLKKSKIKQLYDGFDIDDITQKSINQFSSLINQNDKSQDISNAQFLIQWITEIDISQKLFYKKLQTKQKKQKTNEVKVGKIMEQFQDDQKQSELSKDSF